MDPEQQKYWQSHQNQAAKVPADPAHESAPQSAYNGYDLTAPRPPAVDPGVSQRPQSAATKADVIQWDASEYIHHQKGFVWYAVFGVIVLILLGVSLWTQNWTFAVLIVVMSAAMAMYAFRRPSQVHYTLTAQGLQIDKKQYSYTDFRAFGIIPDGGLFSVMFIPTKRFMPAINIYFAEDDGERIVDMLGSTLPIEKLDHDPIDKLMRRLHF